MLFPSVTQILAPFSGIEELKRRFPDRIAHAAERGTLVHNACEDIARGYLPMNVSDEIQPYIESFMYWFDKVESVHLLETRLIDTTIGYTGQFDIVCKMKGDTSLTLVDYKSPVAVSKTWKPQLAAYRHLAEIHNIDIGRHASLRIRKNGKPALLDEFTSTYTFDWNLFISCLNVYNNLITKGVKK